MARRDKSLIDAPTARRLAFATVRTDAAKLLGLTEEICQTYPGNEDMLFLRYLLRMVMLAAEKDPEEH
ncbi:MULTISPECIES: hypothetical protein [unclassified Rhizobium]|uniref:hypothetical protein n=1 Tax=unclassified Rhizobium TaxID=2613769 RepID=UPI00161D7719|nr:MULTISPECIES: hypothetical protein [unclassified Rhizobium]MBB3545216.1 hypothetical protein [Rhizobium sp. BK399]MCS4096162.1 hypothetical protein [Rhizobium sp. BK176]